MTHTATLQITPVLGKFRAHLNYILYVCRCLNNAFLDVSATTGRNQFEMTMGVTRTKVHFKLGVDV